MKQYRPILFSFLLLALCLTAACAWDNPSPAPGDASSSSAGEPGESSAVAVSDVIPFSQAVTQYAGNAGLSYQAARTAFPAGTDAEPAEEAHYRILSLPLSVTASYTPRLILYCAVSEADASLASVDAIQLLQQEGNTSQQNRSFHGDIQVWLRGNTQLEYVINGDFYNGGTTTALASGLPIGPGQTGRVTLSLHGSRVPPHLQYFYDHKTLPFLCHGIMGCPFAPALVAASLSDPNPSMWSCLLHMDGFFIVDFMPVSMQRQLPS